MTNPKPVPGAGLFIGAQDRSNEVIDRPPAEYVFRIPDHLVARSWYQGHQGLRRWRGRDVYMDFFVDPVSRVVFGQPDLHEEDRLREAWSTQDAQDWAFDQTRALCRWLGLHHRFIDKRTPRSRLTGRLLEFWCEYVDGKRADRPPLAVGLPRDPDVRFAGSGWAGWEDFFWETARPRT
jgi:hypothetical protein